MPAAERHRLRYALMALCASLVLTYMVLSRSDRGCVVTGSHAEGVDGFYVSSPGGALFVRSSLSLTAVPELFELVQLTPQLTNTNPRLVRSKAAVASESAAASSSGAPEYSYVLTTGRGGGDKLFSAPGVVGVRWESPASMVPPASGWHGTPRMSAMDELYRDELVVNSCQVQPAPTTLFTPTKPAKGQRERRGGVKVMMERPGTHLMLGVNMYIAWVLYKTPVPVERVALSYERVVKYGEYWRVVTASLAHYDVMHLLFNMMSLYNLGELELVFGTFAYLYYTCDLLVLTIAAAIAIYHVLITRFHQERYVSQPSVGYSCVLFAWMTVLCIRVPRYCAFNIEYLCFDTYHLPVLGTAFNFAPVFLVFATSFIMPRASMVGHGAGIVLGYPLAWGLLSWITTPTLVAMIMGFALAHRSLPFFYEDAGGNRSSGSMGLPGSFVTVPTSVSSSSSSSSPPLPRIQSLQELCNRYSSEPAALWRALRLATYASAVMSTFLGTVFRWHILPPQAALVAFGIIAPKSSSPLALTFSASFGCMMAAYHAATLVAIAARYELLRGSGLTSQTIQSAMAMVAMAALTSGLGSWFGLRLLQRTPSMDVTLRIFQLERRYNLHEAQARAFSGAGRVLGDRPSAVTPETTPVDLGFRL